MQKLQLKIDVRVLGVVSLMVEVRGGQITFQIGVRAFKVAGTPMRVFENKVLQEF